MRVTVPATSRLAFEAQAGWRHTYGTLNNSTAFAFTAGGTAFTIRGANTNRNEATLDLRATYRLRPNLRIGAEANATVGERGTNVRGAAFVGVEF